MRRRPGCSRVGRCDQVGGPLGRGRAAGRSSTGRSPTTDLDLDRHRGWWQFVRVLQWLLLVAVLAGLGWLASAFVLAYMQLATAAEGDVVATARADGAAWSVAWSAGLVTRRRWPGSASRSVPAAGYERPARRCASSIAGVTADLVVAPVGLELDRYEQARAALERARA